MITDSYIIFLQLKRQKNQTTMACQHLCLVKGAQFLALISKLHPKPSILKHQPNPTAQQCIEDLQAVTVDETRCGSCLFKAVYFTSESLPGEEVYCALKYCKVKEEGPAEDIYDNDESGSEDAVENQEGRLEEVEDDDPAIFAPCNVQEDIKFVCNQGLKVDNDNEPAPKNVPAAGELKDNSTLNDGQSLGWDKIDQCAATGAIDHEPSFNGRWNIVGKIHVDVFKK